jgi:hypothetical protein
MRFLTFHVLAGVQVFRFQELEAINLKQDMPFASTAALVNCSAA